MSTTTLVCPDAPGVAVFVATFELNAASVATSKVYVAVALAPARFVTVRVTGRADAGIAAAAAGDTNVGDGSVMVVVVGVVGDEYFAQANVMDSASSRAVMHTVNLLNIVFLMIKG